MWMLLFWIIMMVKTLNPLNDKIKTVYTDGEGKVETVLFTDENTLDFKDFIELFKQYLRTNIAGEVISWDDVWRFTRQTDAKAMEEYLDNVEQEGILKGSRFELTSRQKMSLGALIVILLIIGLVFVMFGSVIGN